MDNSIRPIKLIVVFFDQPRQQLKESAFVFEARVTSGQNFVLFGPEVGIGIHVDGFNELHLDGGRSWRCGSSFEERCEAIGFNLQAQRQAHPPVA